MKLVYCLFLWLTASLQLSAQLLKLSTASDSALYYYSQGWNEVMNRGDYTASENAYRKMMYHDPNFLVGLSLLGRITRDLQEREEIENKLEQEKHLLAGDEAKLLETYFLLVKFTNLREKSPDAAREFMTDLFELAEQNSRHITHKYPDELFYKSEYIEILHRNYGAALALDSLQFLANKKQKQSAFLLGFAAHMEAELGLFNSALKKAKAIERKFKDGTCAKPYVVYADIYLMMGNKEQAGTYLEKALALDTENIDAQRLGQRIERE
jgi:tetratricopeptide (TPR) repeat protein